jgi:very-short-patch-repair endonuclease
MFEGYVQQIAKITKRGDAREESYYSALKDLLEEFSLRGKRKKTQVTVLPKKTEAGNPDFRVWDGKHSQVGYVEAKTPGSNLDDIEDTEQLRRYNSTFPNLILTDFYEFRLYRDGKRIDQVLLARPFIPAKLKTVPPVEHAAELSALLERFLQFSLPTQFTAESLAKELAIRTRFLRDQVIKEELREVSSDGAKRILGFYEAFQKHLIANLQPDEFADLYAQTITYGLFAARTRANGVFNRQLAYALIPKTIGILREIFHFVSFDPPEQMQVIVDDIAEVLAVADVKEILRRYYRDGKGTDPIFHFYETFLAEYNPQERERRGVYYTPEPVVSYIVRSLDLILKEKFGKRDGFADHSVTVLDPAGGTLTFLAEAARVAVDEFVAKYGEGSKAKFIEDHVLKHFYAFELMMAPYAAGHLKMGYLLEELGHKLSGDERLQFYLTNTLEMEELAQTSLPGMASLSEESHLAGEVKKQKPILVILGNPPYSGHSANKGDWITGQIRTYKTVDGKPLGEKNPKWLQDDYVKFIRFAQWKIDQNGEGVLGFITNHSYLDNPTFRGMRQSLMNSFDEINILDLHGNSLKKEKAPDGSKDENVFDIQQGVAIAVFVKRGKKSATKTIKHSQLWGLREGKYDWLVANDVTNTGWRELKPASPLYLFVPRDEGLSEQYQDCFSVPDIFSVNSVGIVTARDHFVIDFEKAPLSRRIEQFADSSLDDSFIAEALGLKNTGAWKLGDARKLLSSDRRRDRHYSRILYRPFDARHIFYHDAVVERGRKEVMRHMLPGNLALCVGRAGQVVGTEHDWNIVFCSSHIEDFNLFYRGGNVNFPLYLYPDTSKHDLFSQSGSGERVPNIAPKLIEALNAAYFPSPPSPAQSIPSPPSPAQSIPSPPSPLPVGEGLGERVEPGEGLGERVEPGEGSKTLSPEVWSKTGEWVDLGGESGKESGVSYRKRKLPPYLLALCRQFRKKPTETEAMLWECLRNHRLHGLKFRRQHAIGRYIADFYCHEFKLVVEVDGGIHLKKNQALYDAARQEDLEAQGYTVVRLTTHEVNSDLEATLWRILPSPPSPLPVGEGSKTLSPEVWPEAGVRETVSPESIFHYIYAILYSNAYRKKYAEFLKTDFPRVPFTKNYELFQKLASEGAELADLHLLKSDKLAKPTSKCEGTGNMQVIKVSYDPSKLRVSINPEKWFETVSLDVWEYHIGGYQVAEKWLKDRKGRILSSEEVATYSKIVTALAETVRIQQSLDSLFEAVEESTIQKQD